MSDDVRKAFRTYAAAALAGMVGKYTHPDNIAKKAVKVAEKMVEAEAKYLAQLREDEGSVGFSDLYPGD